MAVKIASCYLTGAQGACALTSINHCCGQCWRFTLGCDKYDLRTAKFLLKRVLNPTGFIRAYLYAITGTCGTTARPLGAALAISNPIDVATIGTVRYVWKTFTFPVPYYQVQKNIFYIIAVRPATGTHDGANYITASVDYTDNPCTGNHCYDVDCQIPAATQDLEFEVWGDCVVVPAVKAGLNIPQVLPIILGQ